MRVEDLAARMRDQLEGIPETDALRAAALAVAALDPAAIEARVRAELAEERRKIVADALMAAREDIAGIGARLRMKASETGDKTHHGTAAGVSLACFRLVELADRAGSSPDTTPEGRDA